MDTWLSHSRPRFELGRGVIAKGRRPALPIIKHLNVFEDVLCRVFTGRVVLMVHELALECPKEAFDTGVVPTVAVTTHARGDAVLAEQMRVRILRPKHIHRMIEVLRQSRDDKRRLDTDGRREGW